MTEAKTQTAALHNQAKHDGAHLSPEINEHTAPRSSTSVQSTTPYSLRQVIPALGPYRYRVRTHIFTQHKHSKIGKL